MTPCGPAPAGRPGPHPACAAGAACRDPWQLELRHTAAPRELARIRAHIAEWAAEVGLAADGLADLQLAVGEAVANGVEHAYRGRPVGPVEVSLALHTPDRAPGAPRGSVVSVRVRDHGVWHPAPVDPGGRGRGLTMIRALADDLDVSATGAGTKVTFDVPVECAA
ncbi:MAG: ATP-binding protein [Pseudonocardia sp.]|nr:ATP-binding protein [Pseudonocardia sp.]